nr:G5 domain-containing protein [Nocardioides convexus]
MHRQKSVTGETVPAPVKKVEDDSMYDGETKVVTEGVDGKRNVVYRVIVRNGDVVRRVVISQDVTQAPRTEVVHVGTKTVEANYAGGSSVWDKARAVRVRWQLGDQHRQRLLRRPAVQRQHLALLRRQRPPAPGLP